MNLIKAILISLGTLSLCMGVIGIVVPGLPTTPFLLLAAGLYVRSSERLYNKLITNRIAGSYIQEFQTNKGMTVRVKIYSICIMWTMITCSCFFFISSFSVELIIVFVGIIGTTVMGFLIPTINISNRNKN